LFREPTDRDAESCATLVDRENERATWGSSLELANHGRERHRKKASSKKTGKNIFVSRDDDAFAILCSEGGVDTTPFKR
jgi:hypothetical protein